MGDESIIARLDSFSSSSAEKSYSFAGVQGQIVAYTTEDVVPALEEVQSAIDNGLYAVGFVSYEAASGLTPYLRTFKTADAPLVYFVFFAERKQIEVGALDLLNKVGGIISMGGDHTIAFPLLRAINKINKGPVALVHFDAHLDTWDTYFGAPYTHGTPFRRAREENLFLDNASMHVGIRGPLYSRDDLKNDAEFGFKIIHCDEFQSQGIDKIVERIRKRVGNNPLYLSIDIDVLDPAFAPGTGTPEIAGMTTREMVNVIRGLSGLNLISADVVEVAPAYDHAEVTSLAAATIVYELTNLFAKSKG